MEKKGKVKQLERAARRLKEKTEGGGQIEFRYAGDNRPIPPGVKVVRVIYDAGRRTGTGPRRIRRGTRNETEHR
jgi:hypothetical protein